MTTEPLLDLQQIPGIAVPGFFKPHQALLSLRLVDGPALRRCADALLALLDEDGIASGLQTLADRDHHRQHPEQASPHDPLVAVAWSAQGLDKLQPQRAAEVPSAAFRLGMPARAGLLGDPPPAAWRIGHGGAMPDLMLVIAGNSPDTVRTACERLHQRLTGADAGALVGPPQFGNVLDGARRGREHFGFADGVSQPAIRGRWRDGHVPEDHIAPHALPPSDPEHDLFGLPGQHRVWPGEFVLGQPASSPDPRLPGPVRPVPAWMHGGTFLVYRRLRQHVEAFREAVDAEAARLAGLPGFGGMTGERLAALLVGRWPSGAPLSRAPDGDDPDLGRAALLNNDFRFDDAAPPRTFPAGTLAPGLAALPPAAADSLGRLCPVAAHIRKVNLRDQASDAGGASATLSRRLLRVGVPYDDPPAGGGTRDRGLLFLSIQASIEDQFEFLQARWINSSVRPRAPGGNDMVVGRGERRCVLVGQDFAQAEVRFTTDFVTMTGGGYFFVPSLPTLRALLQGAQPQGA